MNHPNQYTAEIQSRIESDVWSQRIAKSVSIKYEKRKVRNRRIFSVSIILLIGILSIFTYSMAGEFFVPNLAEIDTYQLLLLDDFNTIYELIYQEDSLASFLEPISFF